jgi:hypothetical protein
MKATAILLALRLPASLEGQGPRHAIRPPAAGDLPLQAALVDSTPGRDDLTLAFGGVIGAIGGLLAGGFIGARIELAGGCSGEWCGFSGGLLGAAIGSTVMIPVGVHFSNDERGDLEQVLGASGFALAGGIAFALVTQDATPLLLIPMAQIISAVAVEKRTSPERSAQAPYAGELP